MTATKGRQKLPDADVLEKAKQCRREYQREYRRRNADRVRQWNADYWIRRSQRASAEPDSDERNED